MHYCMKAHRLRIYVDLVAVIFHIKYGTLSRFANDNDPGICRFLEGHHWLHCCEPSIVDTYQNRYCLGDDGAWSTWSIAITLVLPLCSVLGNLKSAHCHQLSSVLKSFKTRMKKKRGTLPDSVVNQGFWSTHLNLLRRFSVKKQTRFENIIGFFDCMGDTLGCRSAALQGGVLTACAPHQLSSPGKSCIQQI